MNWSPINEAKDKDKAEQYVPFVSQLTQYEISLYGCQWIKRKAFEVTR